MFLGKGREQTLELLERAKELELKAREVAEGVLIGIHRSRHRGTSIEFSEHKPYAPGDEIRLIDWKLYAKTDRYFIKQFEDETRIRAYLLLDASGSMAYPPEKKLLRASLGAGKKRREAFSGTLPTICPKPSSGKNSAGKKSL